MTISRNFVDFCIPDAEHGGPVRHEEHGAVPEGRGLRPESLVTGVARPGVVAATATTVTTTAWRLVL